MPVGNFGQSFGFGFGIGAKFLFGVSEWGEITGTTGIDFFKVKSELVQPGASLTYRIVPIMIGYRHNINNLYLEPQAGIAIYGATASYQGQTESSSENAFTWAAGLGYRAGNADFGLRYQSGEKNGVSQGMIVFHVGYVFDLGMQRRRR